MSIDFSFLARVAPILAEGLSTTIWLALPASATERVVRQYEHACRT